MFCGESRPTDKSQPVFKTREVLEVVNNNVVDREESRWYMNRNIKFVEIFT